MIKNSQVCLTPWVNGEAPSAISCLTVNSSFGLLAYGNGSGLVIVDFIQVDSIGSWESPKMKVWNSTNC